MKNSENPKNTSFKELVEKAKSVGFDKVPESTSVLETRVIALFEQSQKILTAKQCSEILGEKETKWYSDKLWYLAKKGILVKLPTRGYYKFAGKSQ